LPDLNQVLAKIADRGT